jgi:hypothetical protein
MGCCNAAIGVSRQEQTPGNGPGGFSSGCCMLLWSCGAKFEDQVLRGLVLSTILACDGVERHVRAECTGRSILTAS